MRDADVDAALDALRRRTLAAPAKPLAAASAKPFDYAPIYYPGTPALAQAAQLTLAAGQELSGLDFSLQRVSAVVIDGMVTRPDGRPAAGAAVQLTAADAPGPFATGSPVALNATTGSDGRFRISSVSQGDYRLVARAPVEPAAPISPANPTMAGVPSLWAVTDLSIGMNDVEGLVLSLEPGATLSGRVMVEGGPFEPAPDLTNVRVLLLPPSMSLVKPGTPITSIAFVPPSAVKKDGTFEITNIVPGTYQLSIQGAIVGERSWWARSAILGARDLLDERLEIGRPAGITAVAVTLTRRHTELTGTLQTPAGMPVSNVFVVAYATDRRLWTRGSRRVQATRPGVDGRFSFIDLPVGDYFVAALTDVEPNEWQESGFLERIVPASLKITIGDSEKKVQDLRLAAP
jgi:hypothetical protein